MKKYIIIAGVNGAGKSTLYEVYDIIRSSPRVNTDEIVKSFGDWKNKQDVFKAGKIAVSRISEYFEKGITFNQETTLCGKSIISNIKKAKDLGYSVEIHYVGVNSVKIAKVRVSYRVKNGGHGIEEKDIERRFKETFVNLNNIIKECDLVVFYDNTTNFRRFAIIKKGNVVRISKDIPKWFEKVDIRI